MELPSGAINASDNKFRMLGYTDASQFVHYASYTALLHHDDYEPAMQAMRDHLEGRTDDYDIDYRIKKADGSYATFHDKGKIVSKNGEDTLIAGVVRRIS